jgi:hypothetical protein
MSYKNFGFDVQHEYDVCFFMFAQQNLVYSS